jgi:hypothetical protein
MLARSAAIAAMPLADCLASRVIPRGIAARIVARSGLCGERFARSLDRAESVFAARFWHARLAVPAPALEHRLATQRACDRIS